MKIFNEHIKGVLYMLWNGSNISSDGHKVMVSFPPGYGMKVQVPFNPGSGGLSQVQTDINTIGPKVVAQDCTAVLQEGHNCCALSAVQFRKITDMAGRGNEEVSICIGEAIEQDDC